MKNCSRWANVVLFCSCPRSSHVLFSSFLDYAWCLMIFDMNFYVILESICWWMWWCQRSRVEVMSWQRFLITSGESMGKFNVVSLILIEHNSSSFFSQTFECKKDNKLAEKTQNYATTEFSIWDSSHWICRKALGHTRPCMPLTFIYKVRAWMKANSKLLAA